MVLFCWIFLTCHLNSCNFGQHYNLIYFLGKHSQEFPETLGRLVINYCLLKLLVTYGRESNICNMRVLRLMMLFGVVGPNLNKCILYIWMKGFRLEANVFLSVFIGLKFLPISTYSILWPLDGWATSANIRTPSPRVLIHNSANHHMLLYWWPIHWKLILSFTSISSNLTPKCWSKMY